VARTRFFLHIDAFDPHEPWDPPQHYVDMYDPGYTGEVVDHPAYDYADYLTPAEIRHCRALYAGEVTLVDTWMGRLFETIEHLGLYEDTAVIFMSDHGHYIGDHGRIGKSGFGQDGPWPFYEEVSHIVMMARVPGGHKGARIKSLVQPVDIMPTIMELAGVPLAGPVDGVSLVPLLHGGEIIERSIVVTSSALSDDPDKPVCSAINNGEWTLQYRGPNYPAELHNLRNDPAQTHDLYAERRDVAKRLHQEYLDLLRRVGTDPRKLALVESLPG